MSPVFPALWLALIAVQAAWWWPRWPLVTLAVLPLLAMALALRGGGARARGAAALLTIPYFVVGATEWMVERELFAGLTVAVCSALYLAIVALGARARGRRGTGEAPREGTKVDE